MRGCPVACRVVGVGHVELKGERPCAIAVHDECDVLDVVVLIAGDDVGYHRPKLRGQTASRVLTGNRRVHKTGCDVYRRSVRRVGY